MAVDYRTRLTDPLTKKQLRDFPELLFLQSFRLRFRKLKVFFIPFRIGIPVFIAAVDPFTVLIEKKVFEIIEILFSAYPFSFYQLFVIISNRKGSVLAG